MMKINKGENEEKAAIQNYEDALKQAHEQITELTYANSKKNTVWLRRLFICVSVAIICMGIFQWNFGYPLSKKIGAVPSDALSGSQAYEQLKNEIEVNHLLRGLITDDVNELDLAKSVIRIRPNGEVRGAEFSKDLTSKERKQFIQAAYSLQQVNTLNWIKNQPNWDAGLNKDVVKLVNIGPERYAGKTAKDWRDKYYAMKKHHHANEHGSDYEEMKIAIRENKISQSKLNAALAFIHDDIYYWNKVDVNDLNENWEIEYAKRIDQAPKMKAYLFQKQQATTQIK